MAITPPARQLRIPPWAKKVVPVLASALILSYYFHDYDWEKFLEACRQANLGLALAAIVLPQLALWLFESLLVERTLHWFHGPFSLRAFFWVRGAGNILMFVNQALGGGGLLLYQQRKARITWRKLMGIALFRFGMVMWGMGFVMIPITLAMHHYGLAEKARINLYVWWFILLFPGVLFFFSSWLFWFHGYDHLGVGKLIVRHRESEFWTAFRLATPRQWFLTWAMAAPAYLLMLVAYYFLNLAFSVRVPFLEFIVVAPLAMLIMELPIAFAGFGTATLAWTILFGRYGSAADLAALTLFLPSARAACRALIGLLCLRPALKELGTLLQEGQPISLPPGAAAAEAEEA